MIIEPGALLSGRARPVAAESKAVVVAAEKSSAEPIAL
jgi:hypothetical protein